MTLSPLAASSVARARRRNSREQHSQGLPSVLRMSAKKKCSIAEPSVKSTRTSALASGTTMRSPAGTERRVEDRPEGRLHQIGMGPADTLLLALGKLARRKSLAPNMARDVAGPNKDQLF